ncbi:MAG: hypothetical protein KDK76_01555 [Chlamydiia bacterium]|nr:hypothetical protein [Chlamydiia bacterium]
MACTNYFTKYFPGATKNGASLAAFAASGGMLATRFELLGQQSETEKKMVEIGSIILGCVIAYQRFQGIDSWKGSRNLTLTNLIAWGASRKLISHDELSADGEEVAKREEGISEPEWRYSVEGEGRDNISLHRLPPLKFAANITCLVESDGLKVQSKRGETLFTLKTCEYFTALDMNDYRDIQRIEIKSPMLEPYVREHKISSGKAILSEIAPVNLPADQRGNYNISQDAASYAFVYPMQLNPENASATALEIMEHPEMSTSLKSGVLIGGYVYFNRNGKIIDFKPLTVDPESTDVLRTGIAINFPEGGNLLPKKIKEQFLLGCRMASAQSEWAAYGSGVENPHAQCITAPKLLKGLTHFSYIPQTLYEEDSPGLFEKAPFGLFLYKTKSGDLQGVPIGGDFGIAEGGIVDQNQEIPPALLLTLKNHLENPHKLRREFPKLNQFNGINWNAQTQEFVFGNQRIKINAQTGALETAGGDALDRLKEIVRTFSACCFSFNNGKVCAIRDTIMFATQEHLKAINFESFNKVNFFYPEQNCYVGIDCGGLTRDYIDLLIHGIAKSPYVTEREKDGDRLLEPQGGRLSEDAKEFFKSLGKLFKYAYGNNEILLGKCFSSSLFEVLKGIELQEFQPEQYEFSVERAYALGATLPPKNIRDLIRDIDRNQFEESSLLTAQVLLDDYDLTLSDLHGKKGDLKEAICQSCIFDKLEKVRLIAKGMGLEGAPWRQLQYLSCNALMEKIQGDLDKEKIANAIRYTGDNASVRKKVNWMKNYIRSLNIDNNEADAKFLENFVRATRGASALPAGVFIGVNAFAANDPYIKYHTCSTTIDIPHGDIDAAGRRHYTKELFIQAWKESVELALAQGFGFG